MSKTVVQQKYKNPAIKEAIFEAKFDYEAFDSAVPGQIFEQVKNDYPNKQDIKHELIFLERDENTAKPSNPIFQAPLMRVRKEDNSELLQFGPGIAVANRLKYSTWEDFIPAIKNITRAYISAACPKTLTRVGIRYINKFLIPEESININEYFNIGIQVPDEMVNLESFNVTLSNKIDPGKTDYGSTFNIRTKFFTDVLIPNETGNKFILDIDCYTNLNATPEINRIVTLASHAHNILGEYFENIITDRIRTLMEIE